MACNFIRGAVGLEAVHGGDNWGAVFSYDFTSVLRALVAHQCSTLEELELLNCTAISSVDQQAIMSSCRRLKRLWIVPVRYPRRGTGLHLQDVVEGEWVCLGLRELYVTLDRTVNVKSALQAMRLESLAPFNQESAKNTDHEELQKEVVGRAELQKQGKCRAVAWAAKRVYSQIGRLVELKVLSIGAAMSDQGSRKAQEFAFDWDLTLSKGWLAELSGLKNLRHLHLRMNFWTRMGQAEVEFMDANWPLLESLAVNLDGLYASDRDIFLRQPHWQWLEKRRPHLLYVSHSVKIGEPWLRREGAPPIPPIPSTVR
ncbi:hypothetical protein BGZ72_005826 [Mortierella alpina]|nr:hypothetical protein BGZ72_005826 [Mortierella alpina]